MNKFLFRARTPSYLPRIGKRETNLSACKIPRSLVQDSLFWSVIIGFLVPWTQIIFKENIFIGLLCVLLGALGSIYFLAEPNRYQKIVIVLSYLILFLILVVNNFDRDLVVKSDVEIATISKRQGFYVKDFGEFYANRFGLFYSNEFRPFLYKFTNNIAVSFDFLTYFRVTNLRESRVGVLMFPLILIGILAVIKKIQREGFIFLLIISLLSGFIDQNLGMGNILFYPVIISLVSIGFITIFDKPRKLLRG